MNLKLSKTFEKCEKNNACKTGAVVLPFSGEHEAGVEGETRSRSAPPALCSPDKREYSAFVLQATIPLLNKACPCDRQCVS